MSDLKVSELQELVALDKGAEGVGFGSVIDASITELLDTEFHSIESFALNEEPIE